MSDGLSTGSGSSPADDPDVSRPAAPQTGTPRPTRLDPSSPDLRRSEDARSDPPTASPGRAHGPDPGRPGCATGRRRPSCAIWLLGLLCVTLVLPLASPLWGGSLQDCRAVLRYERAGILAGEYWRLLTAHWVHGDLRHLGLNLAGLGLLAALFPRAYDAAGWLLIVLGSVVAIDLGLVFLEPQLDWYLGFSGVLHGVLAAGALSWWRLESKPLALVVTLTLVAKLAWEQWRSALPFSGDLPVVVDAHLYGALGGGLVATLLWRRTQDWSRGSRSL